MSASNIKQLRISEKNSINSKLIEMRSHLRNKQRTILRFRENETNLLKIHGLEEEVKNLKANIKNSEERINLINSGKLDKEILENAKRNIQAVRDKNEIKRKKKEMVKRDNEERKKKSVEFYNKTRSIQREQMYEEKNKNYYQKYFFKVERSIPDYLIQKLNKMPNNKGYIFRDVYLYGKLPCDRSNKTTLFETKNKIQYIHEWDRNTDLYTIYEKKHRGRKVIIEQRERSLIKKK